MIRIINENTSHQIQNLVLLKCADSGLGKCHHTVASPKEFQHGPFSHSIFPSTILPSQHAIHYYIKGSDVCKEPKPKPNKTSSSPRDNPYNAQDKNTAFPSQGVELNQTAIPLL